MFPLKQINGTNHEFFAWEDTCTEQLTESDHTQCCFHNGNQNMDSFNTFQGTGELKNECLWLYSSSAPNAFENISNVSYQEQAFCNSNPLISEVIWPHENCDFNHDSAPVCNSTQLPQLPYQQHAVPLHYTTKPLQRCTMARNHKAQITLVPTSTGKFKAVVKRKRKRTIFTPEQIEALEQYFTKKPYVTREDRQVLVNQLQLNDKAVKVWFQNRRLKGKRTNEHPRDEHIEECIHPDSRLDYVQSQINQKTDEFGFVTLDDTLMGNLVNVIDSIMSNNYNSDTPSEDASPTIESRPIYEPISPADCTIEEDSPTHWDSFEPKESLRKLFELHTILPM